MPYVGMKFTGFMEDKKEYKYFEDFSALNAHIGGLLKQEGVLTEAHINKIGDEYLVDYGSCTSYFIYKETD